MKATVLVILAAIATPSMSMKTSVIKQQHSSSSTRSNAPASSASTSAQASSAKHVHLSPGSGGYTDCARLEAKQDYYMIQIQSLQSQNITIPAYLAGYASAAADSLEALGCPVKNTAKVSSGQSTE